MQSYNYSTIEEMQKCGKNIIPHCYTRMTKYNPCTQSISIHTLPEF